MKQISLLALLAVTIFAVSCSDDDDENTTGSLTLNISGLEDLGSDYAYEGWVIVGGSPVSTGVFTVSASGALSKSSFEVDAADLSSATMFVVSIEPVPDSDPDPAATKVLAGAISNNEATLTTGLIGDFSNASGSFFLRTPTDEADGVNNENDESGVWFGLPGAPPTADFVLPTLPEGWAYEGWVVGESGPLTTGTFTGFSAVDAAAPYSGTNPGPPVPGEDFFNNAPSGETFPLDVRGRTVVISVEPVPDNSPAPFAIKPLLGTAGQETAPSTHSLGLNLSSLPTGSVSF
ncbi:MAG: anti-sigma factor [Cyclobacteriaceae bacterium]